MAIINGNQLLVFIDGQAIGCTDNCELSSTNETIDATCKDNRGARQTLAGTNSWTITASGKWDFASTLGPDQLFAVHQNKSLVGIKMAITDLDGTEESGKSYYIGYARLNDFKVAGPLNSAATFNLTFEGSGTLSKGTTT